MISGVPTLESSNTYLEPQQRPGLIAFMVFTMTLLAAYQLLFATVEYSGVAWVAMNVAGTIGGLIWIWTISNVIVALIIVAVGYELLCSDHFGRTVGPIITSFRTFRRFFWSPDNRNHQRGEYPHYLWIYRIFRSVPARQVQHSPSFSHPVTRCGEGSRWMP